MGFPQVSTGGLYSTFGDPTIFTTRDNQHFELFENITLDRGAHRLKFGAYYFHLQLRPEQPDNARGAFTYTGQFTGNAFADFLLGYPTSAVSGIGRGDENGRTNWLHLYAQDDWQPRGNLTFNLGLRYEFNQHMYDVGQPAVVDRPASRRPLRDRQRRQRARSIRTPAPLLGQIPHPVRDVGGSRLGTRPDGSERGAPGAAPGLRAGVERLAGRHSRRLRHLPESVGVQRADGLRPQPAVLLHEAGRRAVRCPRPDAADARHPDEQCHWHRRRQHHGLRLQRRVQPDVERRPAVPSCRAVDDGGSVLHGHLDARRGQRDDPQRAGAGAGCDSAATAHPGIEPHQRDPVRRQVHLPRRDAARLERRLAEQLCLQRQLHALALEGRRLEPGRNRVGSQRAAERAEHLRRDRGVGAIELRSPAPVHRQRRVPVAVLQGQRPVSRKPCSAGGAPTRSSSHSRVRRSR